MVTCIMMMMVKLLKILRTLLMTIAAMLVIKMTPFMLLVTL